jgi:uncharacterized protein YggU (UPF0235/DUF167 family)
VIELEPHASGVILPVRAQPGARRDEIRGEQDGALKVAVTQAPERGKANEAIALVLARFLNVRRSQLELLSGGTAKRKRYLVHGARLADIQAILAQRDERTQHTKHTKQNTRNQAHG